MKINRDTRRGVFKKAIQIRFTCGQHFLHQINNSNEKTISEKYYWESQDGD